MTREGIRQNHVTENTAAPGERALSDRRARRVWITQVSPAVDAGRFPIKAIVDEDLALSAQIFVDGHDHVAACIRHRPVGQDRWVEQRMERQRGDTFGVRLALNRPGRYELAIEAWVDRFATFRELLTTKAEAGQDVHSELLEGAALLRAAADRALAGAGETADARYLREHAAQLESDDDPNERVDAALSFALPPLLYRYAARHRSTTLALALDAARREARAGLWYELFPRSTGGPDRHGTFVDVEGELPRLKDLGFTVLYLPPIHPIGTTHRKGPNNTLVATEGDPGSPWAIGSPAGGHTAVHPKLGSLADFDRLLAACQAHRLELAMDIAFQCSPDHPWITEHPEWFRHRPDGTIKHAENPPKKYEDIVPLDFDTDDWRTLWRTLRDVFLFWAERGVRLFRVDNPHTKPLTFWEWCIAAVKEVHPEAIFLSEAFTRPNVQYALAQVGFDQSYTYFTWRNTAWELRTYLEELTRPEVAAFFRPNFFANTPDILPEFLQMDGRTGFMIRYLLAVTLSASSGIYSGYELCENQALAGREEYANSEKYELRHRDWNQPGNINDYIRRVNAAWHENPALHRNDTLRFHPSDNEQLLFYSKFEPASSNTVLVVVNLDPHHLHHGWVDVPIEDLDLAPHESYQMHDLVSGQRYLWRGRRNYVRLDPAEPAHLFRLQRHVRTERDFDYYI